MKNYLKRDWPRHRQFIIECYRSSDDSLFVLSALYGSIFFIIIFALSIFGPR